MNDIPTAPATLKPQGGWSYRIEVRQDGIWRTYLDNRHLSRAKARWRKKELKEGVFWATPSNVRIVREQDDKVIR